MTEMTETAPAVTSSPRTPAAYLTASFGTSGRIHAREDCPALKRSEKVWELRATVHDDQRCRVCWGVSE